MFIKNSTGDGTVVIVPKRLDRPDEGLHGSSGPTHMAKVCPFCPGQESLNEEAYRVTSLSSWNHAKRDDRIFQADASGEASSSLIASLQHDKEPWLVRVIKNESPSEPLVHDSSWRVRVIHNKFPITPYHEVIIHSPDHEKDFDTLPLEQVELIVQTFRQRFDYHSYHKHGRVIIFNNHGIHAGASLSHPHSQLTVVPDDVSDDMLSPQPIRNIIEKTKHYSVFCPDYSGWPYEVCLTLSKNSKSSEKSKESKTFGEASDEELKELAVLIQKYCRVISKKFTGVEALHKHKDDPNVPYNFYISSGENWYLRFIPRLIHPAGFELATNMGVNIIDPKRAAEEYRAILADR